VPGGFLGKGLKFPVEIDRRGGVATREAEESIRQSIQIILGTAPGERVMRPHFGCQIHDLLYAPNNIQTASLAAHFATEALSKWEPRIAEIEVEAQPNREEPNRLDLRVQYRLRASNSSRNLIYPFYLRRSDEL
jgi:phage baseplate assembly protein W